MGFDILFHFFCCCLTQSEKWSLQVSQSLVC